MLKHTPIYELHLQQNGQMVPFVGWEMPLQYKGIIEEHMAVRRNVGLFDVSHMGELRIRGPEAVAALDFLTVNDVGKLQDGQAQYTAMLNEEGGIVDDLIIYRERQDDFLIVANAANVDKDFRWIREHLRGQAIVTDESEHWGELALQGPRAKELLQPLVSAELSALGYFHFRHDTIAGIPVILSRTGYTGEDGFEILSAWEDTPLIWRKLFEAGKDFPLVPCGLGCRDTLRLEARLSLHGNDIDESTNPLEAGLSWIVKLDKGSDFIGRQVLLDAKEKGLARKLVGFELTAPGVPRAHYKVEAGGKEIGQVTSGIYSAFLKKGIGLAYVELPYSTLGSELEIVIRGKHVPAVVVRTPFYRGTAGKI